MLSHSQKKSVFKRLVNKTKGVVDKTKVAVKDRTRDLADKTKDAVKHNKLTRRLADSTTGDAVDNERDESNAVDAQWAQPP
jgi:hypothetical protein